MSSEVWKVSQNLNAQEFYDTMNKNIFGVSTKDSEINALKSLISVCKDMNEAISDIADDQNKYDIEMDNIVEDFNSYRDDISSQIEKLKEEIRALENKAQKGTITEDEKAELKNKKGELADLVKSSSSKYESAQKEMENKKKAVSAEFNSKKEAAEDYASAAIDKGKPWSELEFKDVSFLQYGITAKRKVVGKAALTVGNQLLDDVNEVSGVNQKIINKKVK